MDNLIKNKSSYSIEELQEIDTEINHEEIFQNLTDENCHDFLKIFSILNIEKINSKKEADIVLYHLTQHPNPIREIVGLKLKDIVLPNEEYFVDDYSLNQLTKGIIDINPNISRAICEILDNSKTIKEKIEIKIIEEIEKLTKDVKAYEEATKDTFNDKIRNKKNHAKNKKLFSLYWLLEALSICLSKNYNSKVLEIINFTINFTDYTIREKTAKIIANMDNAPIELLKKAKYDQNFYVKNQVYDKINFED